MDPDLNQLQYNVTILHPAVIAMTSLLAIAMFVLPRHRVLVPFLWGSMLIPMQQCLAVFEFDFNIFRILLLVGVVRALFSDPLPDGWRRLDTLILAWTGAMMLANLILWHQVSSLIYVVGWSYNLLGIYFLGRFYVRSPRDITIVYVTFASIMVVLAVFMIVEKAATYNAFHIFGGLRPEPVMREGVLRAQGPFKHPILAGSYGGVFMAAALALWLRRRRFIASLGLVAGAIVVWASASSGPLFSAMAAIGAMLLWRWRAYMQPLRRTTLITLLVLHVVMKAPVWALLWRATVIAGSTGYHRYALFDQFMRRIPEWAICGVRDTSGWGYYLFDITNQYVLIGVNGGLLGLTIFLLICGRCFQSVGRALPQQRNRSDQQLVWSVGAIIVANLASFFGVAYFDQMMVSWYLIIGIAAGLPRQSRPSPVAVQPVTHASLEHANF